MSDGICTLLATNNPKLSGATSQQSTEVISANQYPAVLCQDDHLLWCGGGIELTPHLKVTFHPIEEVIQSIQQWRRVGIHAEWSDTGKPYQGNSKQLRQTYQEQCYML